MFSKGLAYQIGVDPLVQARLHELNRLFYEEHADSFSASRRAPWPGWNGFPEIATSKSVVDVGCGNGRYLSFLRTRGFTGRYLGIDGCAPLLEIARKTSDEFAIASGTGADVSWQHAQLSELPHLEGYEHVVAWGLLHHVAGFDERLRLLREMLSWTVPQGSVCVSLWQFRNHARFARHECDPARFGFAPDQLEGGDALLDWKGDSAQPRYCHHFPEAEIEKITSQPDLVVERVQAEADSDRFNAYLRLRCDSDRHRE